MDIDSLRSRLLPSYRHVFTHRDVILYALSVGCNIEEQLTLVYEDSGGFAPLPTFAAIAAHPALNSIPLEHWIPGCVKAKCLHGEQYVELLRPLPTSGTWITTSKLVDIKDKGAGKGVVAVVRCLTSDDHTGVQLAINEFTVFALGAGSGNGSSGSSSPATGRSAAATATNTPPTRPPDASRTYHTHKDQAALYRLNGDYNPLHIDPEVSTSVGYSKPILHGMCTMGIAVRLVMEAMGGGDPTSIRNVKVRFSKHVFPGDILRVDMWAGSTPDTVIFQAVLPERNSDVVLSAAAVTFWPGKLKNSTLNCKRPRDAISPETRTPGSQSTGIPRTESKL